jgi:cobalt-zinc-cadmium resistance protein CzcA
LWASLARAAATRSRIRGTHNERLQRRSSIQVNVRGRDVQSFVDAAQKAVSDQVKLPPRCALQWSGQYHNLQEATARLSVVVPAALAGILVLLVVMFGDIRRAGLIVLNVPIAATVASWRLLYATCRSRSRRRSTSSRSSASRS